MKTITVPTVGKPPKRGSKTFLDTCGANYLLPAGSGPLSKPHSVALCVGTVGSVSNGSATINLLESHPGCAFIEELAAEDHLRLTADKPDCSHLTLTQSAGSSGGQIQESLTLMESKMQAKVPAYRAHRVIRDIAFAESFTPDQKLKQISRFLDANYGHRQLTESATRRRSTAGVKPRTVADVLRSCRRGSVSLQESKQPPRLDSIAYVLRHCR